ncbi:MAG TPA: carboxypeptidase-like regulatory domain-containing protein [Candidatus Paceibacterota bacterium]|nr:carboxypeptidase-like regulatory domain-containing protein [Candidatus Paceibacterota bacterium]
MSRRRHEFTPLEACLEGARALPLTGFSLIDVIVGVALLLVVFLALFSILRASLALSTLTKAKSAAVELASTQMEYMRGISYDALGTVGGIPAGTITQYATSTVDGVPYTTHTFVEYADDPADGTGANDTNGITTDYKIGEVTVSYSIYGLAKSVSLVSNFAPPGIETSTGGGTLSLHVVDAGGADLGGASVRVVNDTLSPAVDFTTFTNTAGLVTIDGAATSSAYQIYVSRAGYSSAQTYAHTAQNVNPTPGYLTIVKNQTTSATFAIDQLATLTLSSFALATTTVFSDAFADASKLASQSETAAGGGALTLASQALSGSARSVTIAPGYLDGWGILSVAIATTTGTSAVVHVDDASGTPLPDAVLPGNIAGFSSFPVSLTSIATSSYPALALEADLTSDSTTTTPALSLWSLSHTEGPAPLPNIAFTLTGTKTIGSDASSTPIYKTIVNDTTGSAAGKTETLEWDAYSIALQGARLIESCPAAPYPLAPASATTTALLIGTPTAYALPLLVTDSAGNAVGDAQATLATSGYAATIPASACGLAYFNGLASTTYSATVSAPGHTTTVIPSIGVSGNTATTTVILP